MQTGQNIWVMQIFYPVPVSALIDSIYAADRMSDFDVNKASSSKVIQAGLGQAEHEETTHLSIVDEEGNAVAVTTTLNGAYGSSVVVGDAGFYSIMKWMIFQSNQV